jgi:hypothetical protein
LLTRLPKAAGLAVDADKGKTTVARAKDRQVLE